MADETLGPEDAYDPDKCPASDEHRRRMEELFGDLDDLEEEKAAETPESLLAEREMLKAQAGQMTDLIRSTREDNQELVKRGEALKLSLRRMEEGLEQERKQACCDFANEVLPIVSAFEADILKIGKPELETDQKFRKLVEGMEKTVLQLTSAFNKHGARPAAPQADAKNPEAGAQEKSSPAPDAPEAPARPDAGDTLEDLRSECDALRQDIIRLGTALNNAQTDNLTLARRLEEARQAADRAEEKISRDRKYVLEKFLKEVLPAVDTLELGLSAIPGKERKEDPKYQNLASGIETTLSRIFAVFGKYGVRAIDPIGETFDENKHEVITTQPRAGVEPETVIHVMQKGYALSDRLIRPAKVIVTPPD